MIRARVLLVAAATSLLILSGCSSDGSSPADRPTASSSTTATPTPSAPSAGGTTTPAPAGKLIDYETDDASGITISTAADTAGLAGAPDDFKAFIADELAKDQSTSEEGCTEKPQIYVSRIDTGGWAAGGHFVPQCGGYATLWARTGGTWKEVWGGQQLTDCATLEKYAFPAAVVGGTCLDGDDERPYAGGS